MDRLQQIIGDKMKLAGTHEDMSRLYSVRTLYLCLIEACRLDEEVFAAFKGTETVVILHMALLLNRDTALSKMIADCILNECKLGITYVPLGVL